MASATRPSLHVRNPKRRNSARGAGRIVLGIFSSLVATGLAVVAIGAVTIGLLRLVSVPLDARPEARAASRFAEPSSWQAWSARPKVGMAAQWAVVASLSLPVAPSPAPEPEPAAAFALATADTHDVQIADRDVTGSLGILAPKLAPKPAPTDLAPDRLSVGPSAGPDALPLPSPRPRPRLASLTPPDVPGIKPDVDARFLRTAIYDITARTVYLPNGERLEAHSGLGQFMDDPRHVHRKMRGATPPNTYKLRLREALFHGVRAIRLTPENEADMFGRDGMLAHSYLLGPNGQSHGCVSFKDYPRFLRAFLRGEIDRMIVVTRLDKLPTSFARRDVKSASDLF